MKNDTMFSVLLEYQDKEWYEQHKMITFNTIYGDATYEVAAVILSKAFNKGEELSLIHISMRKNMRKWQTS